MNSRFSSFLYICQPRNCIQNYSWNYIYIHYNNMITNCIYFYRVKIFCYCLPNGWQFFKWIFQITGVIYGLHKHKKYHGDWTKFLRKHFFLFNIQNIYLIMIILKYYIRIFQMLCVITFDNVKKYLKK